MAPVAFLDRDGTLIEDRHYLSDPAEVVLLPGAVEGLRSLAEQGYRLVVVTNQSGVARGLVTPAALAAIHAKLEAILAGAGILLDGIYSCPHDAADCCGCRKPEPGLALRAVTELGLDLSRALVVGDKASDLDLGRRLGVPAVLVLTGTGRATLAAGRPAADHVVPDLAGLARLTAQPGGLPVGPQTFRPRTPTDP